MHATHTHTRKWKCIVLNVKNKEKNGQIETFEKKMNNWNSMQKYSLNFRPYTDRKRHKLSYLFVRMHTNGIYNVSHKHNRPLKLLQMDVNMVFILQMQHFWMTLIERFHIYINAKIYKKCVRRETCQSKWQMTNLRDFFFSLEKWKKHIWFPEWWQTTILFYCTYVIIDQ